MDLAPILLLVCLFCSFMVSAALGVAGLFSMKKGGDDPADTPPPSMSEFEKQMAEAGEIDAETKCSIATYKGREPTGRPPPNDWACPKGTFDTGINWAQTGGYMSSSSAEINAKQCTYDKDCVKVIQLYAESFPNTTEVRPKNPTATDVLHWATLTKKCYAANAWDTQECKNVSTYKDSCKKASKPTGGFIPTDQPFDAWIDCVAAADGYKVTHNDDGSFTVTVPIK